MSETAPRAEIAPAGAARCRANVRQTRNTAGGHLPPTWREKGSLAGRAIDCLWPYQKTRYPGVRSGVRLSLKVFITWDAVRHWMTGRARLPMWAAEALQVELRAKGEASLALAEELGAYLSSRARELKHRPGRLKNRPIDE